MAIISYKMVLTVERGMSMQAILCDELLKNGVQARVVSIEHLDELKRDMERTYAESGMSDRFSAFLRRCYDFNVPENLPHARSIIIAAVKCPGASVLFNYKGKKIPLSLPPTYVDMFQAPKRIMEQIKGLLESYGYKAAEARLPMKLLAVRSGLGFYGRNNICYIPGMGSFAQLAAFYSDIPCGDDHWQDARRMDACENCFTCLKKCPTGSIVKGRAVIDAEKCLCYVNEGKGEFPEWVDPSWHNSIVGCFLCQEACPGNRDYLEHVVDMGEFSAEETDLLLRGEALDGIPPATREKLERLNLITYYYCLPRNLKVLLDKAAY